MQRAGRQPLCRNAGTGDGTGGQQDMQIVARVEQAIDQRQHRIGLADACRVQPQDDRRPAAPPPQSRSARNAGPDLPCRDRHACAAAATRRDGPATWRRGTCAAPTGATREAPPGSLDGSTGRPPVSTWLLMLACASARVGMGHDRATAGRAPAAGCAHHSHEDVVLQPSLSLHQTSSDSLAPISWPVPRPFPPRDTAPCRNPLAGSVHVPQCRNSIRTS